MSPDFPASDRPPASAMAPASPTTPADTAAGLRTKLLVHSAAITRALVSSSGPAALLDIYTGFHSEHERTSFVAALAFELAAMRGMLIAERSRPEAPAPIQGAAP